VGWRGWRFGDLWHSVSACFRNARWGGSRASGSFFMSIGEESFQLLRKLRENSPLQSTPILVTLRLKNPETGGYGDPPLLGLNTALDIGLASLYARVDERVGMIGNTRRE